MKTLSRETGAHQSPLPRRDLSRRADAICRTMQKRNRESNSER